MRTDWTTLIGSWLPFVVLILVWIFLTQWMGPGRLVRIYEAHLKEIQRTNALLDRIAAAVEKRAGTSA
jgi:hypothetical protein